MKKKYFRILLSFIIFLGIVFPHQASANQEDLTPPKFERIEISPKELNVGETLIITAKITDDKSGVESAMIDFFYDLGNRSKINGIPLKYDKYKDLWIGEYEITEFDINGKWDLESIHAKDREGNYEYVHTRNDPNFNDYYYIVNNPNEVDTTPPVVESIEITPKKVEVGQEIIVQVKASDHSGIRQVSFYFDSLINNRFPVDLKYDSDTGFWIGKYKITPHDVGGIWDWELQVYDNLKNGTVITRNDLVNPEEYIVEVNNPIETYHVKGRIIDINGNPLNGIGISLVSLNYDFGYQLGTESNGEYSFSVPKDNYQIIMWGMNNIGYSYLTIHGGFKQILGNTILEDLTFTNVESVNFGAVSGKVYDKQGNPYTNIYVELMKKVSIFSNEYEIYAIARTDEKGMYSIGGLEEGIYNVTLRHTDGAEITSIGKIQIFKGVMKEYNIGEAKQENPNNSEGVGNYSPPVNTVPEKPIIEEVLQFKDIDPAYQKEINYLVSKGIINGYDENYFKPKEPTKRIQAIQMILREKGITDLSAPDPKFSDIKIGTYGHPEIAKAVELGIISGKINEKTGERYFDPNGILTRAEMAKILTNAYNIEAEQKSSFKDVKNDAWYYPYISTLAANGVVNGYEDNTFRPHQSISRLHFALMFARYLNPDFRVNE